MGNEQTMSRPNYRADRLDTRVRSGDGQWRHGTMHEAGWHAGVAAIMSSSKARRIAPITREMLVILVCIFLNSK